MKRIILISAFILMFSLAAMAQEKAIAIGAGEFWQHQINATEGQRIAGRFRARGGSGNDVEVYIFDSDGFENWRNGHEATTYYNSGRATVGTFDVNLRQGTYYLVISNTFSSISSKAVTLSPLR